MSSDSPQTTAAPTPAATPQHEVLTAVRNALQIGGSLMLTYSIALVVRILLPRHLGPDDFGSFNWADGFSAAFFVATTLGIDTYIRKEVTLRPEHASDFFGGTLVLRLGMTVLLMGALSLVMAHTGESPAVRQLVFVFAGAQLLINLNATLAALLHARGTVGGLSVVNVAGKLVWGGGLLAALFLNAPLPWLAVPVLAAETLKSGALWALARRHLGLVFRVDAAATRAVLKSSLPYYITGAALAAHGRTDVTLLGILASKQEVGYYGAAWGIGGLVLLITPIFGWVLMPLMSRAAARSEEELTALVRRTLEGCLALTLPVMLATGLGAELWVELLYGPAFAPGAFALRVLAPLFVLTYTGMVSSTWLTLANQAWTVTFTSVTGMFVNPLLNWVLIPPCLKAWGPSGGAAASALSMILTDVLVVSIMLGRMGRRSVDRRTLVMLGKTLAVCAAVVALDRLALQGLPPLARLLVDALAYVALVLVTGAVKPSEVASVVRLARNRRAPPAPEALPT
ncbi:flippase [Myxococcaceae bacterium GXIMD 01537]